MASKRMGLLLFLYWCASSFAEVRFVVLSTIHSGTTWYSEMMNNMPGIACGLEEMSSIGMSKAERHAMSVKEWGVAAQKAFERVQSRRPGSSLVGFKVMYYQLPRAEIFQTWLVVHKIAVIHLIRGASILIPNNIRNEARSAGVRMDHHGRRLFYVNSDATVARIRAVSAPKVLREADLKWVKRHEIEVEAWRMRLHSNLRLWVHEIYYEHLLGPWSRATFELSSSFLHLANNTGNITSPKSISHRVHNMTCAMRLANWEDKKAVFKGTRTFHFCKSLDDYGEVEDKNY